MPFPVALESVTLQETLLKEHDRIAGKLLQPDVVKARDNSELRDCLDGTGAIPVKGYYVSYLKESTILDYPQTSWQKNSLLLARIILARTAITERKRSTIFFHPDARLH